MPGKFSKSSRPKRPGAYFNFEALQQPVILPAAGSIVAVPFTADWGPTARAVLVQSLAEYQSVFGYSTVTEGYKAVRQAFIGEGVQGRGGAGGVLCYRMAATPVKATHSFPGAAASSLAITAVYDGTKGNDLRVTIQDNLDTTSTTIIFDGTVELERYTYATTSTPIQVAAQINALSDWVTAVGTGAGALTPAASVALSGGTDGLTITGTQWTAAQAALEIERFGILAPANLTDGPILASLKTWVQGQNNVGKRFSLVVGGALNEVVATAIARSASLNDPNIVNVGVGSIEDDVLGVLSTAQLAPRIAGILAYRGEAMTITYARLSGVNLITGPTQSDILSAFDAGVVVLARDSNQAAPVHIEKGLTTFTDTNDVNRPYLIYRQPKNVRVMQGIETELTEWSEANVVGLTTVNTHSRDAVVAEMGARIRDRERRGILQPGSTIGIDQDPPPSDNDEFIAIVYGIRFGRTAEQIFNTVRIG